MGYREIAHANAQRFEGFRAHVYLCPAGQPTIGYGHKLTNNSGWIEIGDRDIRIDLGMSKADAWLLLRQDLSNAEIDARELIPSFDNLSANRKAVVIDMAFNLGRPRLSGFNNMLDAVGTENWSKAADEMVDSRWYGQVGGRAVELVEMMRRG